MLKVHKRAIPIVMGEFELELPKRASALKIGVSAGEPCVWFLIPDVDKDLEPRRFVFLETEKAVGYRESQLRYVGSIATEHLFEVVDDGPKIICIPCSSTP
jgi:hypothetical protein